MILYTEFGANKCISLPQKQIISQYIILVYLLSIRERVVKEGQGSSEGLHGTLLLNYYCGGYKTKKGASPAMKQILTEQGEINRQKRLRHDYQRY